MEKKIIFVITPIGKKGSEKYKKFDAIFKTMIVPAVKAVDSNFELLRADHIAKPGSFIKDILTYLQTSYIIIANLTELNPNVFYELGVRHTLSNRTIMITENLDTLPSDLKQYRTIEYNPDITGVEDFKAQLVKCIQEIIKKPNEADNPVQDHLFHLNEIKKNAAQNKLKIVENSENKKISKIFEEFEKRVERILAMWNARLKQGEAAYSIGTGANKTTYKIQSPLGNFENYFIMNADGKSISSSLIISIQESQENVQEDFIDIQVMLQRLHNQDFLDFKFVIVSNISSTERKAYLKNFQKILRKYDKPDNFSFEIWGELELTKIEKDLGLVLKI